jgi:phosphatidylglycerol:prolipoprotein diacylglycerol transferase
MLAEVSIRFVNLGFEINNLGKSISVFGFEIAYYGIIIAIGMLCALFVIFMEAKKTGQNVDNYYDLAMLCIIFGVIGARLYYVVFEWDSYKDDLVSILKIRNGGLAIYGGIIAGLLVVFIFSRVKKLSFAQLLDTIVLGLLIGQIFGRWGNFFNREAFGGYTDNIFAMQIKLDEVGGVISDSIANNIKIVDGIEYIQVHPTFLYESLWNLVLLIFILLYKKHKKCQGDIACIYMIGYGIGRAAIETLRTDQLMLPVVNQPVSILVSVIMIILGISIMLYQHISLNLSEKSHDS